MARTRELLETQYHELLQENERFTTALQAAEATLCLMNGKDLSDYKQTRLQETLRIVRRALSGT